MEENENVCAGPCPKCGNQQLKFKVCDAPGCIDGVVLSETGYIPDKDCQCCKGWGILNVCPKCGTEISEDELYFRSDWNKKEVQYGDDASFMSDNFDTKSEFLGLEERLFYPINPTIKINSNGN